MPFPRDEVLVWWTSEVDCKLIGDDEGPIASRLPKCVREGYGSRLGRCGRGRIWHAVEIRPDELQTIGDDFSWDGRFGRILEQHHAGILFHISDLDLMRGFPGVITDADLVPLIGPRPYPAP